MFLSYFLAFDSNPEVAALAPSLIRAIADPNQATADALQVTSIPLLARMTFEYGTGMAFESLHPSLWVI